MQRIIIATKNAHKTEEFRALLGPGYDVVDLTAFPEIPAAEETGATFEENAHIKALHAASLIPGWVLADDSGLDVLPLHGAPGVHSARYAGPGATDAANRAKLVAELRRMGGKRFAARFHCVIAVAEGTRILGTWSGMVEGAIALVEQGSGGFGYDALFTAHYQTATFAQLSSEVKNRISHRALAFAAFREWLAAQPPSRDISALGSAAVSLVRSSE